MYLDKRIILVIFIILIIAFSFCYENKQYFGFKGHKLLCDYKLIDHQHEIVKNLWLGDYESSQDKLFLKEKNIKLIINLSKTLNFIDDNSIAKFRINIHDNLSKESNIGLIDNFDYAYQIIDKTLRKGDGVLIHCRAGVQRSAALTALYLMKKKGINSNEAKKYIKSKRCIAFFHKANFEPVLKYFDCIII